MGVGGEEGGGGRWRGGRGGAEGDREWDDLPLGEIEFNKLLRNLKYLVVFEVRA